MPKHPDFQKIYRKYIQQYGEKKGKDVYFAWLKKKGYDDTKPFPKKESYPFVENYAFKYTLPFRVSESKVEDSKDRTLMGTLLTATTSRNNVTYEAEEINNALFNGRIYDEDTELTLSLNHTDDVTDNVGLWKPVKEEGKLNYRAKVFNTGKHPYVTEMIDKGLMRYVSVEAIASKVIDEGETVRAVGLDVTGMGLVKTPGIAEASAALAEAFKTKKEEEKEVETMAEEEQAKDEQEKSKEEKEDKSEEKPAESEASESALNRLVEKLDAVIKSKDNTKELESKVADLEKRLTETKTKGNVTSEAEKPLHRMVKEKNRYAPGKVDISSEDICY